MPHRVGQPDEGRSERDQQPGLREAQARSREPEVGGQEGPDQANALVTRALGRDADLEGSGAYHHVFRPADDVAGGKSQQRFDQQESRPGERFPERIDEPAEPQGNDTDDDAQAAIAPPPLLASGHQRLGGIAAAAQQANATKPVPNQAMAQPPGWAE